MTQTSESQLIQQICKLAGPPRGPSLIRSIGDDCAIVRPRAGRDMVFTTDFVLQDRHFTLDTHSPSEIGHKALARSLSDLAAMGAEPLFCLVSLALPADLAAAFVPRFYKGLLALALRHGVALAGGDLARFPSIVADVMCCGTVAKGKAFLRSAAQAGDFIYVTGKLGKSALGFRLKRGSAWKQHRLPTPRIEAALELRRSGIRCAMDISDGLSLDLARLCIESKVSAELSTALLPIAAHATLDDALNGGEDYELLFTAPQRKKMPSSIAGIAVTRVGCITTQKPYSITLDGKPLPPEGFDHFA
jgi:thiamine-monophosphate kinase